MRAPRVDVSGEFTCFSGNVKLLVRFFGPEYRQIKVNGDEYRVYSI